MSNYQDERDTLDEDLRDQGELTFDKMIRNAWRGLMEGTHTALPGIVVSYDPISKTAAIQPAFQVKFLYKSQPVTVAPIPNVPVSWYSGLPGACVIWPDTSIKAGTECLLIVSQRSLDSWYKTGGIVNPNDMRMFDMTDSVAFLGFSSQPNAPTRKGASTSLELQLGNAWIEITQAGLFKMVGASGQTLTGLLNDLVNSLSTASTVTGMIVPVFPNKSFIQILAEISNLLA